MSFGLRGGGFSSGTLNPFGTSSGGFGQYNIASDSANEEAALDKYQATVAWQQGRLDDDAYLGALEKYLKTTAKDSRERTAAEDDLLDASYTISRNEVVNKLNNATGTARRISLWQDLIAVDRKRLSTMTAGDNEQRRELLSRIDDQEGNIRQESWSDLVRRYNSRRGLPIEAMLRAARRLANRSVGSKDHQSWLDQVDQWTETKDNDTLQKLQQEWAKHPEYGGGAVLRFLDERIAKTGKGTPKREQLQQQRDQTAETIATNRRTKQDSDMEWARKQGTVSDEAYLQYWSKRLRDAPNGTDEKRSLKQRVYDITIQVAIADGEKSWSETGDPSRLLGAYNASLAGMKHGSAAWRETYQTILRIQGDAWKTLDLLREAPNKTGGAIYAGGTGSPPGYPGTGADGFASQYDGSDFANQNCGYTAAAMLAWAAGVKGLSGGDMRWYAGDPQGASFLSGMATAMERVGLGLEINQGLNMDKFRRRVANGEAAIVNGLYGNLTGQYRLSSFGGAHSVTVTQAKKSGGQWWYFVMDPIGRGAKQGAQWWPESMMRSFAWSGARNPISGNSLMGVVSFARKNGSSVRRTRGRHGYDNIPFQAFDTDANGNSTIGKGGGNSRREAGYMPPNFAKKARGGKEGSPTDEIAVWSFLGAISKVAKPDDMPESIEEEARWFKRAKRLLDKYDGDVRMAGAQWFTRTGTSSDPGEWTQGQVHYANAIGSQFKLPTIDPKATEVEPVEDAAPTLEPGERVRPPATPEEVETATRQREVTSREARNPTLGNYSAGAVDIAKRALKEAGIPYSEANVRSVIAVLEAVNGGEKMDPLNPFRLATDDAGRFEGQTGVGPNGQPEFASASDPTQAAIEAAVSMWSPELVAAGRTHDPRRFLDAFARSGLSPALADNNLVRVWNDNPGNQNIYGVNRGIHVPSSLTDLVSQEPDLQDLYNIDPLDDNQMAWWKRNVENQRAAGAADAAKWTFERSDGTQIELDYFPYLLVETAGVHYTLSREVADFQIANGDQDGAIKTMQESIASLDPSDLTIEGLKNVTESMLQMREQALMQPGGVARARDIMLELNRIYAETMQSSEEVTVNGVVERRMVSDPALAQDPRFRGDPEAIAAMEELNEAIANDPILDLMVPKDGVNGIDEHGNVNGDRGFMTSTVQPNGKIRTDLITDVMEQDQFNKITVPRADGSEVKVPAYTLGRIPVDMPNGSTIWQAPEAQAGVTIYTNQPISGARAATTDTTNLGPQEQMFRGQVPAGSRIVVPDITDPDGQRTIIMWSLGPNPDGTRTWLAMPEGVTPSLIYTGQGRLTDDGAGGFLINDKPVDMKTMAGDFTYYGADGNVVKGVPGVGGPNMNLVVRTTGPGSNLSGVLTPGERFAFGGDYWPRDWAAPISDAEVGGVAVRATGTGPRRALAPGESPYDYEGNPPGDFIGTAGYAEAPPEPEPGAPIVIRTSGYENELPDPPASGPTPSRGDIPQLGSTLPHGSARLTDLSAFLRNVSSPMQQAIAREAQRTRAVANQAAAVARTAELHRQAVARQSQIREAQRIRTNVARTRPVYGPPPPRLVPTEAPRPPRVSAPRSNIQSPSKSFVPAQTRVQQQARQA